MSLLKNFARANSFPVKCISTVLLFTLAMLLALNSHAGGLSRKHGVEEPYFEKPTFETPAQQERRIEKPVFEKAKLQSEQRVRPILERPVMEKSTFQRDRTESASLTSVNSVAAKESTPSPRVSPSKWKPIRSENRRIRYISFDRQLQGRAAPIYR